mgnify:CR=1 FL=1
MFPRLVLVRQEARLLAEPPEALHEPDFLLDVQLPAFEQHVVAVEELRRPAVVVPPDADLEMRDVEGIVVLVGVGGHGHGCGWRGGGARLGFGEARGDGVEEEGAAEEEAEIVYALSVKVAVGGCGTRTEQSRLVISREIVGQVFQCLLEMGAQLRFFDDGWHDCERHADLESCVLASGLIVVAESLRGCLDMLDQRWGTVRYSYLKD